LGRGLVTFRLRESWIEARAYNYAMNIRCMKIFRRRRLKKPGFTSAHGAHGFNHGIKDKGTFKCFNHFIRHSGLFEETVETVETVGFVETMSVIETVGDMEPSLIISLQPIKLFNNNLWNSVKVYSLVMFRQGKSHIHIT